MPILVGCLYYISRSNLEKINVRAILSPGTKHWSVITRYMSVLSARVSVKRGLTVELMNKVNIKRQAKKKSIIPFRLHVVYEESGYIIIAAQ